LRIAWTLAARLHRDDIWLFLAERNVDYADRVERRIAARVSMLERFPKLGRPLPGKDDMRELSVPERST